jgi:hypothetical protein
MHHTSSFNILAIVLIIVGGVFLLENFGFIDGAWLVWPVLPLIMGLGFCILFFKTKRDIVLLGLGSFVLLNSLFFFYLNFIGWSTLVVLWPVFIVILGITFLACYMISKSKVLAYLAALLIALGTSFILIFVISTKLWPISLVFAGISFIIINIFELLAKRGRNARKK